ncbi:E3 ubiquitin-protein ligase listerin [Astathelohania contejeani]|uniref:E3 ubiquitin-protein ligase listerin n=1 Tax=Astathelohania contejeani TaxID=164912 RepID=A0ABQ7HYW9_9MICR|nr:E3 ubiquitin-protein ligase listerin [Thelohania contejeani]
MNPFVDSSTFDPKLYDLLSKLSKPTPQTQLNALSQLNTIDGSILDAHSDLLCNALSPLFHSPDMEIRSSANKLFLSLIKRSPDLYISALEEWLLNMAEHRKDDIFRNIIQIVPRYVSPSLLSRINAKESPITALQIMLLCKQDIFPYFINILPCLNLRHSKQFKLAFRILQNLKDKHDLLKYKDTLIRQLNHTNKWKVLFEIYEVIPIEELVKDSIYIESEILLNILKNINVPLDDIKVNDSVLLEYVIKRVKKKEDYIVEYINRGSVCNIIKFIGELNMEYINKKCIFENMNNCISKDVTDKNAIQVLLTGLTDKDKIKRAALLKIKLNHNEFDKQTIEDVIKESVDVFDFAYFKSMIKETTKEIQKEIIRKYPELVNEIDTIVLDDYESIILVLPFLSIEEASVCIESLPCELLSIKSEYSDDLKFCLVSHFFKKKKKLIIEKSFMLGCKYIRACISQSGMIEYLLKNGITIDINGFLKNIKIKNTTSFNQEYHYLHDEFYDKIEIYTFNEEDYYCLKELYKFYKDEVGKILYSSNVDLDCKVDINCVDNATDNIKFYLGIKEGNKQIIDYINQKSFKDGDNYIRLINALLEYKLVYNNLIDLDLSYLSNKALINALMLLEDIYQAEGITTKLLECIKSDRLAWDRNTGNLRIEMYDTFLSLLGKELANNMINCYTLAKGTADNDDIKEEEIWDLMTYYFDFTSDSLFYWYLLCKSLWFIRNINLIFFVEKMIKSTNWGVIKGIEILEEMFYYNFPSLIRGETKRDDGIKINIPYYVSINRKYILNRDIEFYKYIKHEANIKVDGVKIKLLTLSNTYELKMEYSVAESIFEARIEICKQLKKISFIGKKETKFIMQMNELARRTCRYSELIGLWKMNIDKIYAGVKECMICYFVVEASDKTFPEYECGTCLNKFHNKCIFTWVDKSGKNGCPICRQSVIRK